MTTDQPTPSYKFGFTRDWPGYFASVAGKEPRETLVQGVGLLTDPHERFTIDLGCGEGRDTAELLGAGCRVLALDGHPEGIERLLARDDLVGRDRLEARVMLFEDMAELPACDLLNASFSLPFCPPEHFGRVWSIVAASIRSGGLFCGQLFGDRHTWASIPDRTHQPIDEARSQLAGFELIRFDEDEKDSEDFEGNAMHWHLYHIVARKR